MKVPIVILLFLLTLSFWSCEETSTIDEDDKEAGPPTVPKIHTHNPDILDDKWGPDALTDTDGIYIEWDANAEEDLAGYKVYRSTSSDDGYKLIDTLSKAEMFYEDNSVRIGTKYYYRITAYDEDDNESRMSEIVWYTLLPKPTLTKPPSEAVVETLTPTFNWIGLGGDASYLLHVAVNTEEVEADEEEAWKEIWVSEEILSLDVFNIPYNSDGQATEPLEDGRTYRWRVDAIGGGIAVGSESRWRSFKVKL